MVGGRKRSRNGERNGQHSINGDQQRDGYLDDMVSEQHRDIRDNIDEKKKTRGFTYLPHVWAINPNQPGKGPLEIEFDKFGNPIGQHKSKYVEFLGTIARNGKLAPLNVKNWHQVSQTLKNAMVDLVKEKFVPCPGFQVNTLEALAKSWRTFKSRIKVKYFDPNLSVEQNLRKYPTSPDERVLPEHWKYLVNYWCSQSAKEISLKNKENRGKKKMQHITGKKSFAQIKEQKKKEKGNDEEMNNDGISEDEMDEEISRADLFAECYTQNGNTSNPVVADALQKMKSLQSQLEAGAKDIGPNDIYAQVTGLNKDGRVRMYGYRTTTADVFGDIPSRDGSHRMNMGYKADMETMKQRLDSQEKHIQDLLRINQEMTRNMHPIVRRASSPSISRNYAPYRPPQTPSTNSFPLQVGSVVYLQSMDDSSKVVAKGLIESLDPFKVIGHEELGKSWCEVKVNVAMEFEEPLLRSMENIKVIGDAIGCSIAWPKSLVVVDQVW